ncbi:MAG: RNA 2',3'-cyclic phosphodiesterase [Gammaproteobacteria bacterium]
MRAFFALDIAVARQYAIEKWRARALPPLGRAVPAANFHITLHFLGEINARQFELLCSAAAGITPPRIQLRLDMPGYFPRPGIFWIGPAVVPPELPELARALRKAGRKAGIAAARRRFEPHVTLFRNCRAAPPLPAPPPCFDIACDGFALFESRATQKGVRYQVMRRWPAGAPA